MTTGKRPDDSGRKTSARSLAPSRIGISRSFSTTRSNRGCDALSPVFDCFAKGTAGEPLLDLDPRLAQKVAPRARFLLHQLLELRGRSRERDLEHLLGQALFHLRVRQDRGD